MRKIKFRGKNVKTGQIHYGFYSEYPVACITDKNLDTWEVEPESVAQLVGYDADGGEVYDDDILVDKDGVEWYIWDEPRAEMFCGGVYEAIDDEKSQFRLKKTK